MKYTFLFFTLLATTTSWSLSRGLSQGTVTLRQDQGTIKGLRSEFQFYYTGGLKYLSCGHWERGWFGPEWSRWGQQEFEFINQPDQRILQSEISIPEKGFCGLQPYNFNLVGLVEVPGRGTLEFHFSIYDLRGAINHPLDDKFTENDPTVIHCATPLRPNSAVCTLDVSRVDFENTGEWADRNKVYLVYYTNHFREAIAKGLEINLNIFRGKINLMPPLTPPNPQ